MGTTEPMRAKIRIWTFLIIGSFSCLYLATRTWAFSYDALTSVLCAERDGLFPIHPNHLFAAGPGWLFFKLLAAAGMPVRAVFAFQTVNAIIAAIAIGCFFYILAARFTLVVGLLGASALGLSYAFWSEACDAGAYASSGLAAVILTGLLISSRECPEGKCRNGAYFLIGLLTGAGVLIHQMLCLAAPSILIILNSTVPRPTIREMARRTILFSAGVFLTVVVPYALIARHYGGHSLQKTLFWIFGPAGPRPNSGIFVNSWWQWDIFNNLVTIWQGLANSVIAPLPPPYLNWAHTLWHGILMAGLLGLCFGTLRIILKAPQYRPLLSAVIAWVALMNLFQLFWAPGTIRFRILFLPALILWFCILREGLAVILPANMERFKGTVLRYRQNALIVLGLMLAALGGLNAAIAVLPASRLNNNMNIVRTLWLGRHLGPNDFFLFAGMGGKSIINVVLPYFSPQARARSLKGYFFANPGGELGEIDKIIDQTIRNGKAVYIEEYLFSKEACSALASYGELPAERLSAWFNRFEISSVAAGPYDYRVAKIKRIRR